MSIGFLTACTDINESLDALSVRLEKIEDASIKSLNEQVTAIKASIEDLKTLDISLKSSIDDLRFKMGDLHKQLEADSAADELTRKALEDEIARLASLITVLQDKDTAFADKIDDLEKYVETGLSETEDWAAATFATLIQYADMQKEISSIKAIIEQNGGDVNAGLSAIQSAIEESEASMKQWVNKILADGYYDIADIDGKIAALNVAIAEGDDALQRELDDLTDIVNEAKSDLTKAYKEAITEAIEANNGVINTSIQSKIDSVNTTLMTIESRLNSFESRLSDLEDQVKGFIDMIQSVVYMPLYSDGVAYVKEQSGSVDLSFKISPSSVVSSLQTVWTRALSVKYLTTTPVTKALPVMKDLIIMSAEFDTTLGIITLTVDCKSIEDSFFDGATSANAALFISEGSNNVSSDFVPLKVLPIPDQSALEPSNSYIISSAGTYKFKALKGNSQLSAGAVSSVVVLWKSFGNDTLPSTDDLIKSVSYSDGFITFTTPDSFQEGNAVIAAYDTSESILWSWHIWMTDQPDEQTYNNDAGIMMDRNLGATSATPGDDGALGLFYQWGRKDPFLGYSSLIGNAEAKSSIFWPSSVMSDSTTGTIEFSIANPTTFITCNNANYDWYYTGDKTTDDTRWTESGTGKSMYDPCPSGWRVPDGGDNGVWSKATGIPTSFKDSSLYDSTNVGINFSGVLGSDSVIWYPTAGYRFNSSASGLEYFDYYGYCWSATPNGELACRFNFNYNGFIYTSYNGNRAYGYSVRCVKE